MGLEDEYALTGWFRTILIASKLSKKSLGEGILLWHASPNIHIHTPVAQFYKPFVYLTSYNIAPVSSFTHFTQYIA
jgi:hypothetical protein